MQPDVTTYEFARGEFGADELQQIANAAIGATYHDHERPEVQVRESGHGLDPTLTTIVITIIASAGSHAAEQIWDDVVWPAIKRRSSRGLGEKKQ